MEHKRQRVQFGWVCLKTRKKGPDVWVLRYRENLPDGSKKRRSVAIEQFRSSQRSPRPVRPPCLGCFR